jgi:hypothetical protein
MEWTKTIDWLATLSSPAKAAFTLVILGLAAFLLFKMWGPPSALLDRSADSAASGVLATAASSTSGSQVKPMAAVQPEPLGLTIEEFERRVETLQGRFAEREKFLQGAVGKSLRWKGNVVSVASSGSNPRDVSVIIVNGRRPSGAMATYDESFRDRAFGLNKGDVVFVEGVVVHASEDAVGLRGTGLEFVAKAE